MTDTNFSYMEVSAKRKKRNQVISVMIIAAIVLLGVIVWGWIELQKSRNAERIKNALNSQVEPGFQEPETALEPPPDTNRMAAEEAQKPAEPREIPEMEPPKAAPREKAPAVAREARPSQPRPSVASRPAPAVKAEDLPREPEVAQPARPAPAREPQLAMNKPPAPKADPIRPSAPVKVFPPEDLPIPPKPEATDDMRQAVVMPKPPEAEPATDASVGQSNSFKLGMAAYRQQDYVNAIRNFAAVPKPASRKRGAPDRDEYVQANFLRGLALLKVGHLSESITAFQSTLEYEKYYPLANMNLGICYVELKQYAKAHQAFEAVVRDQSFIEPALFDDVMQRTKYFWALAWTRLYKTATNPDKQNYYRQQAVMKWKDYQIWFSKNDKYKNENLKAENYLKSLSSL